MNFTREDLQNIRERAVAESKIEGLASSWKRAYQNLADAANCLDAMISRITGDENDVVIDDYGSKPAGGVFGTPKMDNPLGEKLSGS